MPLHPKYRSDIDGLRAIAVLVVVVFHAFPTHVPGGFIGVDIFFVISGFLICTILYENLVAGQFSFADFYARRIRRIFPALILVLAACFGLGWFVLLPDEYAQLGRHMAAGAGFVQNLVLWNEADYFDNIAETKPLLHLWSLGIEEQFYLIWPPILWLAYRFRANLLWMTVGIALASFVANIVWMGVNPTATFYSPLTRFWELLAGASLAYLYLYGAAKPGISNPNGPNSLKSSNTPSRLAQIRSLLGLGCLLASLALINKSAYFPGWWALLPVLGSVLILSAGPTAWVNQKLLSNRYLVWLGLISYPLYLWHWSLLSFARIMASEPPSLMLRTSLVLTSIALAAITYYAIEKPIRFGPHRKAKTLILVILMILIAFVGYNTNQRGGLGFRFKDTIQFSQYKVSENKDAHNRMWRQYTCFLESDQNFSAFDNCDDVSSNTVKPTMVIWGDSHAASLFPGFQFWYGNEFNVIQRTASLCPPILGYEKKDRPNCKKLNEDIFNFFRKTKPSAIVLSAWWTDYDWQSVGDTLLRLKRLGIPNIYLVGPLPEWNDNVPNLIYKKYKADPLRLIPEKMFFGLKSNYSEIDQKLVTIAAEYDVKYLSPRSVLCDVNGCIVIIGEEEKTNIAFDTTHLTLAGSKYLVSKFKAQQQK
jgi:peptidoglycan/LPS O-acetylase OafA/YrhL